MPTLRDLGDRGQAQAIAFLEKTPALEGKSWTQLRDALSATGAAGPGEKDPFQFDRVLVVTVAKGASWDPGDRMMWTRVFVQPINFSFAGYTVAATDNEMVKVTSVEATNSRKFSADIGLTVPGLEGPKASISPAVNAASRRHRTFRRNTRNLASTSCRNSCELSGKARPVETWLATPRCRCQLSPTL